MQFFVFIFLHTKRNMFTILYSRQKSVRLPQGKREKVGIERLKVVVTSMGRVVNPWGTYPPTPGTQKAKSVYLILFVFLYVYVHVYLKQHVYARVCVCVCAFEDSKLSSHKHGVVFLQ